MRKIVSIARLATLVKKFKIQGQKIVLVGGCFDVLHPGHVIFLEKAKAAGDYLVVLLESDKKVEKLKGVNRPVHSQKMRALMLAALQAVDYVVLLPFMEAETAYDKVIQKIQPDIIAATLGYNDSFHHERVANLTGAKLKFVTKMVGNHSTSRILGHSR